MTQEKTHPYIEVYARTDKKFAWWLTAANGNIIATDGGQGCENKSDAKDMATKIIKDGDRLVAKVIRPSTSMAMPKRSHPVTEMHVGRLNWDLSNHSKEPSL